MTTVQTISTTFFTIIGSQDPQATPNGQQGPGLDLLDALIGQGQRPDEVLMAYTPGAQNAAWPGGYDSQQRAFEAAVRERLPLAKFKTVAIKVRPNSAAEVLPVLAAALERFRHAGRLHVNTSSGTPQMLEALKLLRGTGWFAGADVTLWQIDRPEHRQVGLPFHRPATTPFLEETLKLGAAFSALRRFDFAGAQDAFSELASTPLELPGRAKSLEAMSQVAEALYWADARDSAGASEVLRGLSLHVPALTPLHDLLEAGGQYNADALIWLTWGRYDRATHQERTADALIWAVILHELLVVKLAEHHGLPDTDRALRPQDLPPGLFDTLATQVPALLGGKGRELKFMGLKEKLSLLRAPVLGVTNVDTFDAGDRTTEPNPALARIRTWRNKVVHQGRVPEEVNLEEVDVVVDGLLRAFPFQATWARAWAATPQDAPVSARALLHLADELQGWVG